MKNTRIKFAVTITLLSFLIPALASARTPHGDRFQAYQIGQTPLIHVTNINYKRPVTVELILFDPFGKEVQRKSFDMHKIPVGSSEDFSMQPLPLYPQVPRLTVYKMDLNIYRGKSKHIVQSFKGVAQFTVYHP